MFFGGLLYPDEPPSGVAFVAVASGSAASEIEAAQTARIPVRARIVAFRDFIILMSVCVFALLSIAHKKPRIKMEPVTRVGEECEAEVII
jgi:hypothetical protein